MPAAEMISTHPNPSTPDGRALSDCIDACFECAQVCTTCADACLGEETVQNLVRCIRLNQDCADICEATGRILSRQTETPLPLVRSQVEAMAEAVSACAEECGQHADKHEHCRVCMEVCRRCEESCQTLLSQLESVTTA